MFQCYQVSMLTVMITIFNFLLYELNTKDCFQSKQTKFRHTVKTICSYCPWVNTMKGKAFQLRFDWEYKTPSVILYWAAKSVRLIQSNISEYKLQLYIHTVNMNSNYNHTIYDSFTMKSGISFAPHFTQLISSSNSTLKTKNSEHISNQYNNRN